MTNIDGELLINEVQKRPILWDTGNEDYKDKNKKKSTWVAVALSLLPDYKNENEAEQKLILQNIIAKWRTIRDNYVRSLRKLAQNSKSGSAAKRMKFYVYGKQLSFLGKSKELRITDAGFDNKRTEEGEEDSVDVDEIERGAANNDGHKRDSPSPLHTSPKTKRRKSNVEHALVDLIKYKTKKTLEEDEDVAFFYSLLPSLKTLNMDKKFTFRLQTMQFLQNLIKEPTTNQPAHHHSSLYPSTSQPVHHHSPIHPPTHPYCQVPNYPNHDLQPPSSAVSHFSQFSPYTIAKHSSRNKKSNFFCVYPILD